MPRQLGNVPNPATVLSGQHNAVGTVITIPAGRTWEGEVTIAACLASAAGAIAATAVPNVKINGTGAVPPATQVIALVPLNTPAIPASTAGMSVANTMTVKVVAIAPSTNAVTLDFDAAGATAARCVAHGILL